MSFLISFKRADFLNSSLLLFLTMCIICKKSDLYRYGQIGMVALSIICDIIWLSIAFPESKEEVSQTCKYN